MRKTGQIDKVEYQIRRTSYHEKRRRFSAEFKAKVSLGALTGELTLSELASKYNVHPNMITKWKKLARQR